MKPQDRLYDVVTKYNITVPDLREIVKLSNTIEFKRILEDIASADDYYLNGHEKEVDTLREIINKEHIDMAAEFLLEDMFTWNNILSFLENNLHYWLAMEEIIEEIDKKENRNDK